jgi:hypothetical protein
LLIFRYHFAKPAAVLPSPLAGEGVARNAARIAGKPNVLFYLRDERLD